MGIRPRQAGVARRLGTASAVEAQSRQALRKLQHGSLGGATDRAEEEELGEQGGHGAGCDRSRSSEEIEHKSIS